MSTNRIVAGLFALAAVLQAPAFASADQHPATTTLAFTAQEASGVKVFDVSRGGGIGLVTYRIEATWTYDYAPWHIELVTPEGLVFPFFESTGLSPDGDLASWGEGDGVAYAGVGDAMVQTPAIVPRRERYVNAWQDDVPYPEGKLIVAWANQVEPISFELVFQNGTHVTPVTHQEAVAYEMKDFGGGARAGVPAAAVAHVGDALHLAAGTDDVWGYFYIYRSTAVGAGSLTVERASDGFRRELSFEAVPESCICYDTRRWVFTSSSDIVATLDLVGDGRRVGVYVLAANLPAGTLPDDVWQEFGAPSG